MNKGREQKKRLDVLLVHRGLADSREQAQRLILAGLVEVEGIVSPKPGHSFKPDIAVRIQAGERFVGRGGRKLEAALREFNIDPTGFVAADIGASTGGFTDCLLQHGARRTYAVDVGASQLHPRLRNDGRVVLMEHTNARHLTQAMFPEPVDLFVVDVSFISLSKIIPALSAASSPASRIICLVKPQFEAGRVEVSRGHGVISDPEVHRRILREFASMTAANGWKCDRLIPSPIRGGSGNIEYLSLLIRLQAVANAENPPEGLDIDAIATQAFNAKSVSE